MYVYQSVSWLTFLLKLNKYRDISCSWWHIFLKFFRDISGIFVHYFQIISNFLYVCQSISWLTSLLKSGQYRDNSYFVWDIFLKFFGRIPGMFVHFYQIILKFLYVCQSVSLAYFLTEIRLIKGYLLFWMIYLSEILWRHSWDISPLFQNNFNFFLSFSLLVGHFITEIRSL